MTGTNPCGAIQVNYGSLDQGLPPTVIVHPITSACPGRTSRPAWKSVGLRHIVVKGEGNCTGQASLDIHAVHYGRKPPDTTNPSGIIGTSTPCGVAAITGSGFGNTPGKVRRQAADLRTSLRITSSSSLGRGKTVSSRSSGRQISPA